MCTRVTQLERIAQLGGLCSRAYIIRARGNYGDKDERTLEGLTIYGEFLHGSGRLGEAEPLYREALAGRRATLGTKHPDTLTSMSNLAALQQTGTLLSMNNLAALLYAQGKVAESEALFKETLEGRRAALGPQHPNTLSTERWLALVSQQRKGRGKRM
jgi:hypothetical protein